MSTEITKYFRFQTRDRVLGILRTYLVYITSSATAYSARVEELFDGGTRVSMALTGNHRYDISPPQFHRMRKHYRGELIGIIKMELEHGAVVPIERLPEASQVGAHDSYIRSHAEAQLWPNGCPDAQLDDLSDFDWWEVVEAE